MRRILFVVVAAVATKTSWNAHAFQSSASIAASHFHTAQGVLRMSSPQQPDDDDGNNSNDFSSHDVDVLKQRLHALHLEILEEELSRPPNANLGPIAVVKAVMEGLWNSYDPLPDSGFRLLLHSSTPKWRREILKSLGVPMERDDDNDKKGRRKNGIIRKNQKKRKQRTIDYELVASALGSSMGRPHNQFAILVGEGEEEYVMDFSASESQLLDFGDGTCWVECRLRDKTSDELLVLTGWDLVQRQEDGAWMVDWIYWQDFREEFRPGIGGRQEWLVNVRD